MLRVGDVDAMMKVCLLLLLMLPFHVLQQILNQHRPHVGRGSLAAVFMPHGLGHLLVLHSSSVCALSFWSSSVRTNMPSPPLSSSSCCCARTTSADIGPRCFVPLWSDCFSLTFFYLLPTENCAARIVARMKKLRCTRELKAGMIITCEPGN